MIELNGILSFLLYKISDMGTNSFTYLKLRSPKFNLKWLPIWPVYSYAKSFYYKNKGTRKLKILQKLSSNTLMDIYFLTPQYIEWATHQIFCLPDVKNPLILNVILSLHYYWGCFFNSYELLVTSYLLLVTFYYR